MTSGCTRKNIDHVTLIKVKYKHVEKVFPSLWYICAEMVRNRPLIREILKEDDNAAAAMAAVGNLTQTNNN